MDCVDELVAFLRARLDEDEAAAKAAYCKGPSEQQPTAPPEGAWWTVPQIMTALGPGTYLDAGHIARHDPGRVLREVEVKRKLIAAYEDAHGSWAPDHFDGYWEATWRFAAAYSDHPDYRAEWSFDG